MTESRTFELTTCDPKTGTYISTSFEVKGDDYILWKKAADSDKVLNYLIYKYANPKPRNLWFRNWARITSTLPLDP